MTAISLRHAAELHSKEGPTGTFVEVLAGRLEDYGGNVLIKGSPEACITMQRQWRTRTRLVPTCWRKVQGEVSDATHLWQSVIG